jgi:hypothetical protein
MGHLGREGPLCAGGVLVRVRLLQKNRYARWTPETVVPIEVRLAA